MQTAYDWITVMVFAGLVTHFLAQSVRPDGSDISLWHYLAASTGCAATNWLGNEGWHFPALLALGGTLYYAFRFLDSRGNNPPQH